MSEKLLVLILTLLDQLESPVLRQIELTAFPPQEIKILLSEGILRETSRATEIPRPERFHPGNDLIVRQTSKGLFGVADGDNYFDPIPLTEDDVRQYEISLPKLVLLIRRENGINGTGFENYHGLIPLGQKMIAGIGPVDIYLSLPNHDETAILSRFQRLERERGGQKSILLTPRGLPLSPEGRRILSDIGITVASLIGAAAGGTLALDFDSIVGLPGIGPSEKYPEDKRIFQKQGKTWLLVYDGVPKNVNDSIGMSYIAHLLQNPGQDIHAMTLRSGMAGEEKIPTLGSAGVILDKTARMNYKERLSDMAEELREAEENNDLGRIASLKEEMEALTVEIGRATGLSGREREASSDREKVRKAISGAIHRALKAIKNEHQLLHQHLHNSLKIGEFLSYQPEKSTTWII